MEVKVEEEGLQKQILSLQEQEQEQKWREKYPSLADPTDPYRRNHQREPAVGESKALLITDEQWAHFDREGWVVLPKHQVFRSDGEQLAVVPPPAPRHRYLYLY